MQPPCRPPARALSLPCAPCRPALREATARRMDKSLVTKATSPDEVPTPGYMFNEIARITHASADACKVRAARGQRARARARARRKKNPDGAHARTRACPRPRRLWRTSSSSASRRTMCT